MTALFAHARGTRAVAGDANGDAALIARFLRRDDQEAFDILVRRYEHRIFCLASSILGYGNQTEAEDVTQEVFVALFGSLHRFRHECAFSTWLYRLARNRIVDHRRRLARRAALGRDETAARTTAGEPAADALEQAIAGERHERLRARIEQLPELQRVVIHLFYWQGWNTAEIAELLEQSPNTVKSHLFRARRSLAGALAEEARHD